MVRTKSLLAARFTTVRNGVRLAAVLAVLASLVVVPGLPAGAAASGEVAPGRVEVPMTHGWRFHQGEVAKAAQPRYDDSGWQRVSLPHTWNGRDGADGGSYYRGVGWYRKTLPISPAYAGRRLFLQFDGANLVTDVWVNGRHAGRHEGGYAAFRFDVTGLATPGERAVVAVRVDNAHNPDVPPLQGDFTMFGGLHRGVRLLVTDQVHVDALDHGGPGVYVRQSGVTEARADLAVTARVTNDRAVPVPASVRTVVTDAHNRAVAKESARVILPAGTTVPVTREAVLTRPHLWRGKKDPYLYQVRVSVRIGGRAVDEVRVPLGIRTVAMDPDRGFLLNGEPLDLRGVNMHAMRPGKGYAISTEDVDADVAMIEEMGANAVRLAHYQHPQRVYDLADRRGLVLWTEIPLLGSLTASDEFVANTNQQLLELIRQNHHHPSVVVWGAGNELYTNSPDANRLLGKLADTIAEEDPERPSSYAYCCFDEADPMAKHTATLGHNLYFGWYYGSFSDMGEWADRMHARFPERKFSVSEYGAGASVVHQQNPPTAPEPAGEYHPEEWQALYHEGNWRELRTRPFVWGKFIWVMYDFASDGRDEGDRPGLNDKGLVTADRKTRKDAFYWYQANWSDEKVVHITARRDTPRFTPTTDVKVYTNSSKVRLTVNGVRLGARTPVDHVATWSEVELRPGANTVVATGAGAKDRVTWWRDTSTGATELLVDSGARDDHNASAGAVARIRGPIAGTDDDDLYRTYRTGTFGYRLPVADGTYRVTLKLAAPAGPGGDVFNVNAEQQRTLLGLDILAEAGRNTALDKSFTVQVTDGVLDLEFVPVRGDAAVSAITVTQQRTQR